MPDTALVADKTAHIWDSHDDLLHRWLRGHYRCQDAAGRTEDDEPGDVEAAVEAGATRPAETPP